MSLRRIFVIKNKRGQYLTAPEVDKGVGTSKWSKDFKKARLYVNNSYANMSINRVREAFKDDSCYIKGCNLMEDI